MNILNLTGYASGVALYVDFDKFEAMYRETNWTEVTFTSSTKIKVRETPEDILEYVQRNGQKGYYL